MVTRWTAGPRGRDGWAYSVRPDLWPPGWEVTVQVTEATALAPWEVGNAVHVADWGIVPGGPVPNWGIIPGGPISDRLDRYAGPGVLEAMVLGDLVVAHDWGARGVVWTEVVTW